MAMAHRTDYANLSLLSDSGQFVALAGGEFEIENLEVLLYPLRTRHADDGKRVHRVGYRLVYTLYVNCSVDYRDCLLYGWSGFPRLAASRSALSLPRNAVA